MTVSPSPEQLSEHARAMRGQLNDELPNGVGNTMDALCDALESAQAEIARLNDWLVETQMNAHKWMEAHDKLKAGKPYSLPSPADLPKALAEIATVSVDWFDKAIRDHEAEHGPSGGAWNISMILQRLHSAHAALKQDDIVRA
jgi:hypothetical protein